MSSRSSSPEIEGAVGGEVFEGDTDNLSNSDSEKMSTNGNDKDAAMAAFFDNSRKDLMFELRQIQHGEKPVTGQDNRERINHFLTKRFEVQAQNEENENVPANVDSVEEHRPEAVVVEVEGLYQQRPVSSLLRSTAFRQHLNNIIRRSMSSFSITPRSSASPHSSHRSSPAPSQNSPSPARRTSTAPTPPPMLENSQSTRPTPARRQSPQQRQSMASPQPTAENSENNSNSDSDSPDANGDEPDQVRQVQVDTMETLRMQRETLVDEISDLLHRRLVSTSLEGEFRGTLEVHMEERLGQSGADGERVRNFLQSIPVDPLHQRNDFSHLGLQAEQDIDNISVTSISATAVPYAQTNLHLSRELRALKAQMEEMKNMLKLNMEMQLDTQRAIRQEVAAAVSQATGGQAESSAVTRRCGPVNDSHCLICLDSHADSVLYQCGHMCVCYGCGKHLMTHGAKCPVCRAPIRDVIRAYKCNAE